jgi:hypothetical protein
MLPVGVAVAAGAEAVAGGLVFSGARRWDAGQSKIAVVFGAAADTADVTSLSLGLWGRDPVTGQEVALTPEDGTYELIVSLQQACNFFSGQQGGRSAAFRQRPARVP